MTEIRTDDAESMWQMVLRTEFDVTQIDNLSKSYGFQILLVQDRRGFSVLHWAIILGNATLTIRRPASNSVPLSVSYRHQRPGAVPAEQGRTCRSESEDQRRTAAHSSGGAGGSVEDNRYSNQIWHRCECG